MEQIYSEWIALAKEDLLSAEILINSEQTVFAASIYHSHQAIEKTLKALQVKTKLPIIKTHSLIRLASELCQKYPDIIQILTDIQKLDNYYPKLRYPTGDKLSKEDAIVCLNIARNTLDWLNTKSLLA